MILLIEFGVEWLQPCPNSVYGEDELGGFVHDVLLAHQQPEGYPGLKLSKALINEKEHTIIAEASTDIKNLVFDNVKSRNQTFRTT